MDDNTYIYMRYLKLHTIVSFFRAIHLKYSLRIKQFNGQFETKWSFWWVWIWVNVIFNYPISQYSCNIYEMQIWILYSFINRHCNRMVTINRSSWVFLITRTKRLIKSISSSSSCRAASADILDPLSPFLPIIHRLRQVFRVTSCVLT